MPALVSMGQQDAWTGGLLSSAEPGSSASVPHTDQPGPPQQHEGGPDAGLLPVEMVRLQSMVESLQAELSNAEQAPGAAAAASTASEPASSAVLALPQAGSRVQAQQDGQRLELYCQRPGAGLHGLI